MLPHNYKMKPLYRSRPRKNRIVGIAIGGLSLFLLTGLFLVMRLPSVNDHHHYYDTDRSEHRIAIILLFVPPKHQQDNPSSIMSYLPLFCASAVGGQPLVDFLIFHTGVLQTWELLHSECPANVKFINLQSTRGLAERLVSVVQEPQTPHEELVDLIASYIMANPYALVEFKPAFGFIFAEYLDSYSHWGYADFDILFGDLTRWITNDELTEYDIVTYSFGDQQRLYIRGQFSFHKNTVAEVWRDCKYLTQMDQRFSAIIHNKERYQVESAEGCYSAAVLNRNDIKVKYAVKAWTDIDKGDTSYSHGVYLNRQSNVIYKVDAKHKETSGSIIHTLPADWFEATNSIYANEQIPLQKALGERQQIHFADKQDAKCMYWVMQKYQKKLCLEEKVGNDENVLWIDGVLYKEKFENAVLEAPILTAAFFHFQEWKRTYRFEQLASMKLSSLSSVFALLPDGAIPLSNTPERHVFTPLGLRPLRKWTGERSQFPLNSYCFLLSADEKHTSCHWASSWRDETAAHLLSRAPSWKSVDMETDVTLVLTFTIEEPLDDPTRIDAVITMLLSAIERWGGKPCVAVLAVPKASKNTIARARSAMEPYTSVLAIMVTPPKGILNRKALLNMGNDAVPTRFFVSGLEVERGLTLSLDLVALVHQVALANSKTGSSGSVFVLPQIAVLGIKHRNGPRIKDDDTSVLLEDLFFGRRAGTVEPPFELEQKCGEEDNRERISTIDEHWWEDTQKLVAAKYSVDENSDFQRRAAVAQLLEQELLEMAALDHAVQGFDESLILLIDNIGPRSAFLTQEVAREAEFLTGPRCFNALRAQTLALLGYSFDVLPGSFAVSSEESRKRASGFTPDRCRSCALDSEHAQQIVQTELSKASKSSIIWMELDLSHQSNEIGQEKSKI